MGKSKKKYIRPIDKELVKEIKSNLIETDEMDIIFFRDDKKKKRKRKVYLVPIELLKFRKDNGRIASDVLSYESSFGTLNETSLSGQAVLKGFLARKDPEKTKILKSSIASDGQLENAVITCDGFLINGNRRKMVLETLLEETSDSDYKYLKVVILPDGKSSEDAPSDYDIEEIENRYQLQQMGKAEYYNFDRAISIQRKIDIGMSLEQILRDDPNYADMDKNSFKKALNQFKNQFLEPLRSIERYLEYFGRSGHYNTISEGRNDSQGRWQAFLDYYNSVYKKINSKSQIRKLKLKSIDVDKIEEVAFKLIRVRDFPNVSKKLHQIMRDLYKLISNDRARKILYSLVGKNKFPLLDSEIIDEYGKKVSERTKDIIWSNKYRDNIETIIQKAYLAAEKQTQQNAPLRLLTDSLTKLNSSKFDLTLIPKNKFLEFEELFQKMKERIKAIEKELKNIKNK